MQTAKVANVFKTATATASGNTALWTPAGGKKFRLLKYMIQITADAAQSVAGDLDITFQDSASAMPFGFSVFVPSSGGTVFGGGAMTPWIDIGDGFLSAVANNVLNINLSAALTGGKVRCQAIGFEQ
jgi:hypothetical protein